MASEADLDSEIKSLSLLAEHPTLYPEFVRLGCVASLTSLLAHENTDIAIDAAEIVAELVDDDVASTELAAWAALVEALLDAELLDLLHSNLQRLDERQEADRAGVTHILNMLGFLAARPPSSNALAHHDGVLQYLIARMRQPDAQQQNTQGAAEALAILLQAAPASRGSFLTHDGLDGCLQCLAPYRRADPVGSEEEEYAENLLSATIAALDSPGGPAAFLDLEGTELAVLLLQAPGRFTRARALRLLDHALASASLHDPPTAGQIGERAVESAALKPLFAALRRAKDAPSIEHALAAIASLLRHLPAHAASRIRLLAKFVEKDYTALERVVALRRRYAAAVAKQPGDVAAAANADDAVIEEERLLQHQYTLRLADMVIAWVAAEDDGARAKIGALMGEDGDGWATVLRGLKAQVVDLEEEEESAEEEGDTGKDEKAEDRGTERKEEHERRRLEREENARTREMLGALVQALE